MKNILNKKIQLFITIASLSFCLAGCKDYREKDLVILFTNDVHCALDSNIGYSGLAAYKKEVEEKYKYVSLVDCGDAIQGSIMGAITKGDAIIDIMNKVNYDFAAIGNHEFDYGAEQLDKLIDKANFQYLNCNITYQGNNTNPFKKTKPYALVKYGDIKVAYIGITTPSTISTSTPIYFMENNEFVYDFKSGNNGQDLYSTVQSTIDTVKNLGAEYVVALAHLGSDLDQGIVPFDSTSLIANTSGIDVLLDGHTHSKINKQIVQDKKGNQVLIGQTGTELQAFGEVKIDTQGNIDLRLIDNYSKKDEETVAYIDSITSEFDEIANEVVATSNVSLPIGDENGVRMVRNREMSIGDLIADAYKTILNSDIGMINGGGIRAGIDKGDITYNQIINVNPFGNMLCVKKISGAQIKDMLEYMYRNVEKEYKDESGNAVGEDGNFQHVSGLKFDIDTSIHGNIIVNDEDDFISFSGAGRVKNIKVLKNDTYQDIVDDEMYLVSSHNYLIKNGGNGMRLFLANNELVVDDAILDYQALIEYIVNICHGDLSKYSNMENRITIL